MEHYELYLEKAKEEIKAADHMANVTYRLVNDQKILISVVMKIMDALTFSMASVLHYERLKRRIPPFENSFSAIFDVFKARCRRRYSLSEEYIVLIQEIRNIAEMHKKSPVVFSKDNSLVICSDEYETIAVSHEKIKNYINKAKLFLYEAENMVSKNA